MGITDSRDEKLSQRSVHKVMEVEAINKRTLGKFILKCVGHEGSENDIEESILRRQMQTCISELEKYSEQVWQNASVTFSSMYGLEYDITSGQGKHRFMIYLDGKDEIRFKKLS